MLNAQAAGLEERTDVQGATIWVYLTLTRRAGGCFRSSAPHPKPARVSHSTSSYPPSTPLQRRDPIVTTMSGFIGLLLICPILAFELAPPRTLLPVVKSPVGRPLFASEQVEEFKEVANEYATSVAANVQYAIETEAPGFQLLVVGQVSLVLLLLFGEVPLVGDALEFVSGPGLIAAGLILAGAGIVELGPTNLTPFATPVKGNELKTNGIYALSR